jgi:8-oxo-dGTP diphosphatase
MTSSSVSWPPEDPELAQFRGPHVAVDVALLTVEPDQEDSQSLYTRTPSWERGPLGRNPVLAALVLRRHDGLAAGRWALPGRMLRERERLGEAVAYALQAKCGIWGLQPVQLFVADAPTRDSRGWVMSVAHRAVVPWDDLAPSVLSNPDLGLVRITGTEISLDMPDRQQGLPFEHEDIIRGAVLDLRRRYIHEPDPDGILHGMFTLYQLRKVHEAVMGEELDKDLFRRRMLPKLTATGQMSSGSVGKPAQLFTRPLPDIRGTYD